MRNRENCDLCEKGEFATAQAASREAAGPYNDSGGVLGTRLLRIGEKIKDRLCLPICLLLLEGAVRRNT